MILRSSKLTIKKSTISVWEYVFRGGFNFWRALDHLIMPKGIQQFKHYQYLYKASTKTTKSHIHSDTQIVHYISIY